MSRSGRMLWLLTGLVLGAVGTSLYALPVRQIPVAQGGSNDRFEDYIMCTGAVAMAPRSTTDGVWLLDYRSGKLLATVIDRAVGRLVGWAEVDLVNEFGIAPRQNVHFMMTTGNITMGQAALYVAETTTGKFGVYTMGPRTDGQPGVAIIRHDLVSFRKAQAKNN